jgi:hypothetical protein
LPPRRLVDVKELVAAESVPETGVSLRTMGEFGERVKARGAALVWVFAEAFTLTGCAALMMLIA